MESELKKTDMKCSLSSIVYGAVFESIFNVVVVILVATRSFEFRIGLKRMNIDSRTNVAINTILNITFLQVEDCLLFVEFVFLLMLVLFRSNKHRSNFSSSWVTRSMITAVDGGNE